LNPEGPTLASRNCTEEGVARIANETIHALNGNKTPSREHGQKQREEIVRALAESRGWVGGANGAAARIGINRAALVSRAKKFGIKTSGTRDSGCLSSRDTGATE
jgi:transcriptional regulator with GAF, ATPase, and Fis domain